jgi:hypothetical protein
MTSTSFSRQVADHCLDGIFIFGAKSIVGKVMGPGSGLSLIDSPPCP